MRKSRKASKALAAAVALTASLMVIACGSIQGKDGMRAPNYASPIGTDGWEVNCGRNRSIIDDDALDEFYNPNGSVKTYVEFCREAEPSLIERAPRPRSNQ